MIGALRLSLRPSALRCVQPAASPAARSLSTLRCVAQPAALPAAHGNSSLLKASLIMPRRCMSSRPGGRFQNTKKARVEYAEPEQKAEPPPSSTSPFGFGSQQQQQGQQQQMYGSAPASSAMPTYTRDRERDQQGSQWEALGMGTVAHMQKVYGTLALGIGIAAGASMFTMATPLLGVPPLVPGIAAIVPLMGIMYTSNHSTSPALRAGMFAAFTGLSGMSLAPMMYA